MVYGDIVSFRVEFPCNKSNNIQATYQERARSLREKLKMTKTHKKDTKNRSVCVKSTYNLIVQLKCKENDKFVSKRKSMCRLIVDVTTTYEYIHLEARNFFGVKHTNTILANFCNEPLESTMSFFGDFLSLQREKKRCLNIYLLYPYSRVQLNIENQLNETKEVLNFCIKCMSEYTEICVPCALRKETDQVALSEIEISENNYSKETELPSMTSDVFLTIEDELSPDQLTLRSRQPPVRFRHSIGSPSLTNTVSFPSFSQIEKSTENTEVIDLTEEMFGLEETNRFFEQQAEARIENMQPTDINITDLNDAYDEYVNRPKTSYPVLVQRDRKFFWSILFRQCFDLATQEVNVRFAGEAASDVGGPFREFLTLSMKWLGDLGDMLIGVANKLAFKSNTEALLQKRYHLLGQLVALSMLMQRRGPECFHPAIVRALFGEEQPKVIEEISDGAVLANIQDIYAKEYGCLLDMNISVIVKDTQELIRLYMIAVLIHSNFSAISQFSDGMRSISKSLLQPVNYQHMRKYMEQCQTKYTFDEIIALISYRQIELKAFESGSNSINNLRECIAEFEMLLINVGMELVFTEDDVPLRYEDLIFFITGCDRIPTYGFEKKIEILFHEVSLPKASTCGLLLTLPNKPENLSKSIITAVKYGGGFGEI